MKKALEKIIPVVIEVYSDSLSRRGGPAHTFHVESEYEAWFEFPRTPIFRSLLLEKRESGEYGCYRLKVELEPTSRLLLTLEKLDRFGDRDERCMNKWDATWFVQEVSNRTRREVTFRRGGGSWPAPMSTEEWELLVKPKKRPKVRVSMTAGLRTSVT